MSGELRRGFGDSERGRGERILIVLAVVGVAILAHSWRGTLECGGLLPRAE